MYVLGYLPSREKRLLASSCPSVRVYQRGRIFREIWYLEVMNKFLDKIQIWFKSGNKSIGYFTQRLKYVLLLSATLNLHKSEMT